MKERIPTFVIGILVGAIISTSIFLVYGIILRQEQPKTTWMDRNNEQMQPPMGNDDMAEPPAKPDAKSMSKRNTDRFSEKSTNIM